MPATFLTLQERNAYEKIHLKDETDILQCFFPTTDDKHFLHFFNGRVVTTKHRRTSIRDLQPKF